MALTLTNYPGTIESGRINNIFAGFSDVSISFKREDTQIISAGQGIDNKLLIYIAGNITTAINVGESVYIYAEGATYTYDNGYKIISAVWNNPNTEVTIDADYIESADSGYMNYKQNWFLEAIIVSTANENIRKYPSELVSDGTPSGIIEISTSMLVDFLKNEILETSGEITSAREACRVKYREVWRENQTEPYTLIDDTPIVIIFAAENSPVEQFINSFQLPKMYEGYPFFVNFLHSKENQIENKLVASFSEMDINSDTISSGNGLASFRNSDFGILQLCFSDNEKPIDTDTEYVTFIIESSGASDYETGDYNDTDYLTINTP